MNNILSIKKIFFILLIYVLASVSPVFVTMENPSELVVSVLNFIFNYSPFAIVFLTSYISAKNAKSKMSGLLYGVGLAVFGGILVDLILLKINGSFLVNGATVFFPGSISEYSITFLTYIVYNVFTAFFASFLATHKYFQKRVK